MNPSTIKRWTVLGSLLFLTLLLVWMLPEKTADSGIVLTRQSANQTLVNTDHLPKKHPTDMKYQLTKRSSATEEMIDLFAAPASFTQIENTAPATPLTVPPPPFVYIGKMIENGQAKVFLQEGETLYGVKRGDKLGSAYQVLAITNDQIRLLYRPMNLTQTVNIGNTP